MAAKSRGEAESLGHYLQRIADADERRGDEATIVSSIYKEAAANGFHRQALGLVHRLKKMPVAKSAEFIRHFNQYVHACGLDQQPDLLEK